MINNKYDAIYDGYLSYTIGLIYFNIFLTYQSFYNIRQLFALLNNYRLPYKDKIINQ